ncbi:MAG: trypsin-like peptidase domain-containing protein [Candidatus Krumholzibacteriia bacterium]
MTDFGCHRIPRRDVSARAYGRTADLNSAVPVRTATITALVTVLATLSLLALISSSAGAAAAPPATVGPINRDQPRSPFVDVGREVRPAVVNIRTVRSVTRGGVDTGPLAEMFRQFFPEGEGGGDNRFENPGSGSGFVIAGAGDILTNHHVIDRADAIFVRFSGETEEYPAELVGTDPNTDLALIRIAPGDRRLRVLEYADSDEVEVGDWAIAVGNPFGHLEGSLTVGVVSAKGRGDLVIQGLTPRYQDFLQTDASINFGNSGGPLVDIHGRVIGVNTAISAGGQGIGFAVPSNLARRVAEQLVAHGRVIRGYLGLRTEGVVVRAGEPAPEGVRAGARVVGVTPGSPAAAAGVQEGDVVVSFAGREIRNNRQLLFLVADSPLEVPIDLEVVRDGKRRRFEVRLVEFESDSRPAPAATGPWLGMEVASLTSADPRAQRLKEALGVTATSGVLVVEVEEGQPAAEAGIRPGDVLVAVNGRDIVDPVGWERLRAELAGRYEPLTVLLRTGDVENYVVVRPSDPGVEQ